MTDSETNDAIAFEALLIAAVLLVGFWPDLGLTAAPAILSPELWGIGANNTATVSEVVRNLGLLVVAILALSVGTWRAVTARRQVDIANEQARLAERGLFTDRFSRAVANVSSGDLAIRLGGIDALCRMAAEAQGEDYETVMDMLCAFVRVPPHRDREAIRNMQRDNLAALRAAGGKEAVEAKGEEDAVPFRQDIQEILDRLFGHGGQRLSRDGYKVNLSRAHLNGANLYVANLSGADLRGGYLRGADLSGANLIEANLAMTDLSRTDLSEAVNLTQRQLDEACVREGGDPPELPEGLTPPTDICP